MKRTMRITPSYREFSLISYYDNRGGPITNMLSTRPRVSIGAVDEEFTRPGDHWDVAPRDITKF